MRKALRSPKCYQQQL